MRKAKQWIILMWAVSGISAAFAIPAFGADNCKVKVDEAELQFRAQRFQRQTVRDADAADYIRGLERDKAYQDMLVRGYASEAVAKENDVHWRNENSRFNQQLYEAQLKVQPYIFVLVMLVVGAGLGFSYMQFTVERRRQRALMAVVKELSKLSPDSQLHEKVLAEFDNISGGAKHSLEMGPVKLQSNVVGLIVLALSLAFFNIYIKQVYTITDQNPQSKPAVATTDVPEKEKSE